MSDYVKGFTVVFSGDVHEDYFQDVMGAVKMFAGVQEVIPVINTSESVITEMRVRNEMRGRILALFSGYSPTPSFNGDSL